MSEDDGSFGVGRRGALILFVVAGLLIGLVAAPFIWSAASAASSGAGGGTVAVVPVAGTINGQTTAAATAALTRAREDPSIDAVVLLLNSGGGGVASSEELYLQTKRTSAEMPVVGAVDVGALSGAYHMAVAADVIYAKPGSLVGSVGVLSPLPPEVEPNDIIATTGPNKLTGADKRERLYQLEAIQSAFLAAVYEQRGEKITLARQEVAQAEIFTGTQAVRNGLVDKLGGRQAAIDRAARMAGLDSYRVEVIQPDVTVQFVARSNYAASNVPNKEMIPAATVVGQGSAPRFLMMPQSYVADALGNRSVIKTAAIGTASTATNETEVNNGR